MKNLKYPIGPFSFEEKITNDRIPQLIADLQSLPKLLSQAVEGLDNQQLDSPYRPEGWTIRQVVHHIADSHMNGYIRFRLALTEDCPLIKPYEEAPWAELEDAAHMPVEVSLRLIHAMHERWGYLLQSLDSSQLDAIYRHPANGDVTLRKAIHLYAWHGSHHLAHITGFRKRAGL